MFFPKFPIFRVFIVGIIHICTIFIAFSACSSTPNNSDNKQDELNVAIREVSDYLNSRIQQNSKVVFLNIHSNYPDFSEYIISTLSENAVNDNIFSVVDRQQLDVIRSELNFQLSGEVSDESAQSIGKMLGAQFIVSGTITKIGGLYRIQIKAIEVQTAAIQGQLSRNIPENATIAALIKNQENKTATNSSSERTPAQRASTTVNIRWTVGEYTNEWGDKLGKFYVQYDGNLTASHTNSLGRTQDITISEISYSKHDGLSFRTPSATGIPPISNTQVNVTIRNNDGSEKSFTGIWGSALRPYVVIPASDDLVNALSANDIIIRVSERYSRFQFTFPLNFQQAYERLLNREKTTN